MGWMLFDYGQIKIISAAMIYIYYGRSETKEHKTNITHDKQRILYSSNWSIYWNVYCYFYGVYFACGISEYKGDFCGLLSKLCLLLYVELNTNKMYKHSH